jgi:hypothetical protein
MIEMHTGALVTDCMMRIERLASFCPLAIYDLHLDASDGTQWVQKKPRRRAKDAPDVGAVR